MEKENKIFYGTLAVIGIVAFLLFMYSYSQTPNEYIAAPIAIKGIPQGAVKVDEARTQIVPYKGVNYGQDVDFLPVVVSNPEFFKTRSLDEVRFSVKTKSIGISVYQDEVKISIRGIRYSELPIVYDYGKELSIWPAGLSRASWYTSDGLSFTMTESAPWAVNVKISKQMWFALIASVVISFIIGYFVAVTVVLIYRLVKYLKGVNKAKISNT